MKWQNDVSENVKSGLVEFLILQLLTERDMYGYEIRQFLEDRTNGVFKLKEGSLYGPLYRLASRELVSTHREMAGAKRFRMYYHLEPAGAEYLAYGKEQFYTVFAGAGNLFDISEKNKK